MIICVWTVRRRVDSAWSWAALLDVDHDIPPLPGRVDSRPGMGGMGEEEGMDDGEEVMPSSSPWTRPGRGGR